MPDLQADTIEAVLRRVREILAPDGRVGPPEVRFLKRVAERMAAGPAAVVDALCADDDKPVLALETLGRDEKVHVVRALVDVAMGDGSPTPAERDVIRKIASEVGVKPEGIEAHADDGGEARSTASSRVGSTPLPGKLTTIIQDRDNAILMFTDIKDSVTLFEKLGDVQARKVEIEHEGILRRCAEKFNGVLVKTLGDSLFMAFHDPNAAAEAAVLMQGGMHQWRQKQSRLARLGIRIAIHRGRAIVEDYDILGSAANTASRLMSESDEDEVVISDVIYLTLRAELKEKFSYHGPFLPKGSRKLTEIYRWKAPWKSAEHAVTMAGGGATPLLKEPMWVYEKKPANSYLLVGEPPLPEGSSVRIGGELKVIGREAPSDVRLKTRLVSKEHVGVVISRRQCWVFDLARKASVFVTYPDMSTKWQVDGRAPLVVGAVLHMGPFSWTLREEDPPSSPG